MIGDHQVDFIINSRTHAGEMYSIWSHCMDGAGAEPTDPVTARQDLAAA